MDKTDSLAEPTHRPGPQTSAAASLAPTMRSANILLKPMAPPDVTDAYLRWLTDPEIVRFLEARFQNHTLESLRRYVASFDFKDSFLFGVFTADAIQTHIGNVTLYRNPHHGTVAFGYMIGERRYWGTTVATESLVLTFDFVFEQLGARKIWGTAYGGNLGSTFNFKKFGFTREGILRGHLVDGDKVTDSIYYGLLRDEWRSGREKFKDVVRSDR